MASASDHIKQSARDLYPEGSYTEVFENMTNTHPKRTAMIRKAASDIDVATQRVEAMRQMFKEHDAKKDKTNKNPNS